MLGNFPILKIGLMREFCESLVKYLLLYSLVFLIFCFSYTERSIASGDVPKQSIIFKEGESKFLAQAPRRVRKRQINWVDKSQSPYSASKQKPLTPGEMEPLANNLTILIIECSVEDAAIRIGGVPTSGCGTEIRLKAGVKRIEVWKQGYLKLTKWIEVFPYFKNTFFFHLAPLNEPFTQQIVKKVQKRQKKPRAIKPPGEADCNKTNQFLKGGKDCESPHNFSNKKSTRKKSKSKSRSSSIFPLLLPFGVGQFAQGKVGLGLASGGIQALSLYLYSTSTTQVALLEDESSDYSQAIATQIGQESSTQEIERLQQEADAKTQDYQNSIDSEHQKAQIAMVAFLGTWAASSFMALQNRKKSKVADNRKSNQKFFDYQFAITPEQKNKRPV